jgi:hypothetical protein
MNDVCALFLFSVASMNAERAEFGGRRVFVGYERLTTKSLIPAKS